MRYDIRYGLYELNEAACQGWIFCAFLGHDGGEDRVPMFLVQRVAQ